MTPSPLRLMQLPKGSAKRIHPFLDIADQENSMGTVVSADRLGNPSTQWLTASLDLIVSAYSNIHSLANSNSKWANDGLEDIVKLLDMCNDISSNIADVKHYQTLIQSAVHSLDVAGILEMSKMSQTPLVRATNMLEECRCAIINGNGKCDTSTSRSKGMVGIEEIRTSSTDSRISRSGADLSEDMSILKDCTTSVLKSVVKALSLELPRATLDGQGGIRVFTSRCSSLRGLFEKVKNHNRSKGFRFLLHELVTADVLVRKLYDLLVEKQQKKSRNQPAEVKELVESLKKCTAELEEGIGALDSKIKELFNALIRIRVKLLDIQTYSF